MTVTVSGATITNAVVNSYKLDPSFENVTLLLPGNGTNGAQNNTFLDSSTNNFTITRNGNTTQGTFSPYGNNWSSYSNAFADYLSVSAINIGTNPFCIEMWVRGTLNALTGTLPTIRVTNSTTIEIADASTGGYNLIQSFSFPSIPSNTWNHIVFCRDPSNNSTMFLNGVRSSTGAVTLTTSFTTLTSIGRMTYSDGRTSFPAYFSNFRVVVGSTPYDPTQSTIVVPVSPLTAISNTVLLTLQSNRYVDNSGTGKTITLNGSPAIQRFSPFAPSAAYSASVIGGSGYFDGAGDYLSAPDSTALDLPGDFTIEFWVYPLAAISGTFITVALGSEDSSQNGFNIFSNTSNMGFYSNATNIISVSNTVTVNQWQHVAAVRSGSSLKFYLNGTERGSATNSTSFTGVAGNGLAVGAIYTTSYIPRANGYYSNVRLVKGTAVYTANFTPPTAPLTAITNTSLLLLTTNAGAIDNAMMNDMETVGNAQISTVQSKWGGGSIYFDGTGDWLLLPNNSSQLLYTGNFTIEGWIFLNAVGVAYGIVSKGTSTTGWSVNITSGNLLQFSYTATSLTGVTSLVANTWYYFAVVRNGTATGNLAIYLNGINDATSSGAVNDNFNQTNSMYVGADRVGGSALNGYIDDLRITSGVARYVPSRPDTVLTSNSSSTLLLSTSITNGAQNNTFLDSSSNNFTITRNGNTTQGTFSPYGPNWSNFFDGSTDWLTTPNNAAFGFGTNDFTVEFWVFFVSRTSFTGLIDIRNAVNAAVAPLIYLNGASIRFFTVGADRITGGDVAMQTWTHIALSKNSGTTKLFLNGTQTGTSYSDSNNYIQNPIRIGGFSDSTVDTLNGYISNLRIVKGTAVYTANFTPPTAPLSPISGTSLLTCQSNRLIDNSSNAFAITRNGDVRVERFSPFSPAAYAPAVIGGSAYFDGSGDFLSLPSNTAFSFGTGDFTIESWIWINSLGADRSIIDFRSTTNSFGAFYISNSGNRVAFYDGNVTVGGTALVSNVWNHVAYVRSGTTMNAYLNGVQQWSISLTTNITSSATIEVGADYQGTLSLMLGYLSNLRVVKGIAVYTSNFTPPTSPVTAISGTSLLLNFTNSGIFDNAMINDAETIGNAQVSTTTAQWGTTSMYFDGTGDWLTIIDKPSLRFGTSRFQIELWINLNVINTVQGIVGKGTSTTGWLLSVSAANKLVFTYGTSTLTSSTSLTQSTWFYVSIVRLGTGTNQTIMYINNTVEILGTVNTDFNQTNVLYIGADRSAGNALNGYIQDLRITNGAINSTYSVPNVPFYIQ